MTQSSKPSNIPPPACVGDTVAVIAPSGPVKRSDLDSGLRALASHFSLAVAADIDRSDGGFLAGSDARRLDELNGYLADPDVRAIVMARGGYGLTRILDDIDASAYAADPKRILGFSDGTALLHWSLHQGQVAFHGPVLTQWARLPTTDSQRAIDCLTDPMPEVEIEMPPAWSGATLWGGNLCLLSHLVGTRWLTPPRDFVLFIEEVGEAPYAIDRYVTHLHAAGVLRGCRGVWLGDMAVGSSRLSAARQAAKARFEACGLVVETGLPIGHGTRNWTLPLGGVC